MALSSCTGSGTELLGKSFLKRDTQPVIAWGIDVGYVLGNDAMPQVRHVQQLAQHLKLGSFERP